MKKYVVAPALAALAMFVFGAVFWMSPFPYQTLTPASNDSATALTLAQIFPTSGTYIIPGPGLKDEKLVAELYRRGPSAMVQITKEGHEMVEPAVFIKGYVHYFAVAVLLMALLVYATPLFHSFWCRVRFSAVVGLLGALLITCSNPIWWHHPWGWNLMMALYAVLEFTVAGLVLARFTMGRAAAR